MAAQRADQAKVVTDDGIVWDWMSPLTRWANGLSRYEPLRLKRIKDTAAQPDLVRLCERVGGPIAISNVALDRDGEDAQSTTIRGYLQEVRFAAYDANSSDVAMDEIVIAPSSVQADDAKESPSNGSAHRALLGV